MSKLIPGPATDGNGHPAVDPTNNVVSLVNAVERRLDDIVRLNAERSRFETEHTRTLVKMMESHARDLRVADEKLSIAESRRIDAIRQVDVSAVATSRTEAEARAATLASQVLASADTLRTVVAAAAAASDIALKSETEPIKKDVVDLRRYQWEGGGAKMEQQENRGMTQAHTSNRGMWIGILISAAGIISAGMVGFAGIVITAIFKFL